MRGRLRRVPSLRGLWPVLLLCLPRLAGSLLQCTYYSSLAWRAGACPVGGGGVGVMKRSSVTEAGGPVVMAASTASLGNWPQDAPSGGRGGIGSFRGGRGGDKGRTSWEAELFAKLSEKSSRLLDDRKRMMDEERSSSRSRHQEGEDAEEEEEEDVITSLFKRPSVGSKRLHRRLRVCVRKPLGLFLAEDKDGLIISKVVAGGNAEAAGLKVGDRILATMATMGTKMWSQRTLDGVHAAISSRLAVSDDVTFDVERFLDGKGEDSISSRAVEVFEVELEKPLALELVQEGPEGGVYVKRVLRQDTEALRRIQPYDRVVAVSASLGDQLWRTNSLEGVLSAVNTRIGSTLRLQLERSPETARLVSSLKRREGVSVYTTTTTTTSAKARRSEVLLMTDPRIQLVRTQMAMALRERDPERAISIYKLAVERGIAMDTHSCTSLIKAYGMKGEIAKALDVVRMMHELGIRADIVTYNTLLNACEKNGRVEQAASIFHTELRDEGLVPDVMTYSVMINLYGKRKMLGQAVALFEEMVSKGIKPELPAYTTMIKAAVRVDDMETALAYLRRMFDDYLEPDVRLYNTLIWGHCKRLEWSKGTRILRLMESKGVAPDYMTYSYLIACHVDCRQFDDAVKLYKEMREKLIRPNLQMYSIVIDMYAKMGDTKSAADTFKEMRSEKIQPNYVTYTSLMEAFINAGFTSAALSISDEMMKAPGLKTDVASYVMRMKCFVELGNIEAVEGAIKDMIASKIKPNVVVYNEYLRGAMRQGRLDLALRIFATILDQYIPNQQTHAVLLEQPSPTTDITTNTTVGEEVAGSSSSSSLLSPGSTAANPSLLAPFYYEVLRRMERFGPKVKPRAALYVAFLNACIRADRLDLAAEVMELRRSNRLQVFRLFKKHLEVVTQWEDKVDRLIEQKARLQL